MGNNGPKWSYVHCENISHLNTQPKKISEIVNRCMILFSRNIPGIIASFLWLGIPMVSYWFVYCERISEEYLHILHIIVVVDIFATFISYLTLIWIWIFCSAGGGSENLGVHTVLQGILKEQAPPFLFCSPKPSDLEEKVFYEMKDYNGNFSQTKMQNCNFCTKAPRYAKKRQNNLCTQS